MLLSVADLLSMATVTPCRRWARKEAPSQELGVTPRTSAHWRGATTGLQDHADALHLALSLASSGLPQVSAALNPSRAGGQGQAMSKRPAEGAGWLGAG